jgi:hypothetical protein
MDSKNRQIFWLLFTVLGLGAWFLPFGWGVAETFVSLFATGGLSIGRESSSAVLPER